MTKRSLEPASGSEDDICHPGQRRMSANTESSNATKKVREEAVVEDEGPACQSCRKKKSKCSRRQPCSQCVRFNVECYYDEKRLKPGLRTGAVENLSQRVGALENMFVGQGVLWQHVFNCLQAIESRDTAAFCSGEAAGNTKISLADRTSRLRAVLLNLSSDLDHNGASTAPPAPSKRRCADANFEHDGRTHQSLSLAHDDKQINDLGHDVLPPDDLIDDLVDLYFESIHPWIPILHVRQFRERMMNPGKRQKLTNIFHAITSVCVRFSEDHRLRSSEVRARYAKRCREIVILQSMETFSVENLQALVICAFDIIGSGRGPSAWSIVGSMTRTVEQLQLSIEDEDTLQSSESLIKRMAFLPPAESWIEREERRRVFWNVFLMDRFCSIATGWNFSLTSADVKRRLPCEGALWEAGQPLKTPTPYFGISDKSLSTTQKLPTSRPETEDQDSLGGFAYCIEASESLSLVTTFFLRHAINVSDARHVQLWLMRFRELDLRLIQWKLFLPEIWREACAVNDDGMLDPNLTLAHITHNTAVGLLHQGVAYPSPEWQVSPIRLPSQSSAETCLAAATEVSIIAEKYLADSKSPTNAQFAFCLFISGRMLLAHARHYDISIPAGLDSLIDSLLTISRRWNGPHAEPDCKRSENLASKFAARLVQARMEDSSPLDIRQPAYSEEGQQSPRDVLQPFVGYPSQSISGDLLPEIYKQQAVGGEAIIAEQEASPDSISLAFPPLPSAFQPSVLSTQVPPHPFPASSHIVQQQQDDQGLQERQNYLDSGDTSYNGFGDETMGLEDIHSFFQSPFQPTQRISMFSEALRGEKISERE